MDQIKRLAASGGSYLALYLCGMLPTYLLPYVGSNSFLAQGVNADYASATGNSGIFVYFVVHLGCLIALAVLARIRGNLIGKGWIVAFPIVAAVFDFVPGLSMIPLIPTFMHLGAIFSGVSKQASA